VKVNTHDLTSERQETMDKYMLLKDMPGLKAGAIFVHDTEDCIRGSFGDGCLKLAWINGDCQQGFCADTFSLHASVRRNEEWFKKIEQKHSWTQTLLNMITGLLKDKSERG
jgi:hypothetical protein